MEAKEAKELADLVQSAVDELHKAVERQDAEIKKLGEPTAETTATIDKLNTRIDELEVKLQRQTIPATGSQAPESEEAKARTAAFYKFVRQGEAGLTPDERKALVEDATGQYLVTPELESEIERTLPKITVIRPLATVRPISKDRLKLRSLSEVTVGWGKLETGEEPTEGGGVPGAPTYQYAEDLYGLAKIGEDELADSDVNLQAILAGSFTRAIGEAEDAAFVVGRGHTTYEEPEGITTNATLTGATITTTAAGAITIEKFLEMVYTCPAQHRKNGVFIWNSLTELAARQLRGDGGGGAGTGPFLWQPSIASGKPNTFVGYPAYCQDDMESLAGAAQVIAIFGDLKAGYRIIDRQGITLQRLSELYSEAGLVGFKVHKRVGGGVIKPANKALVLLTEHA